MSILVLAADGTGSAEPIDLGDVSPTRVGRLASPGRRRDRVPGASRPSMIRPSALYAVAPGGGTPRILSEPVGPPEFDPAIDRPAISPDGRTVTFWSWGPNEAGEVNGWGRVLNLDTGTERIVVDVGRVGEPDQPGRPLGGGGRHRSHVRVR